MVAIPLQVDRNRRRIREQLRQRFGGACAYCGTRPDFLTLDHVVPRCKGGQSIGSNLIPCCEPCNRSKGSKDLWEWWTVQPHWSVERAVRVRSVTGNPRSNTIAFSEEVWQRNQT